MKIRIILTLSTALLALVIYGCDNSGEDDFEEQLVLQGFLYVGQPLSVRVTHTVKTGEFYDDAAVGVSGATVRIWADGRPFVLREDAARAGTYSLPADSHVVATGSSYRIEIEARGHWLRAQTPPAPANCRIDSTSFPVWRDPARMDTIEYGEREFYLRWNADQPVEGYQILTQNIEPDWFDRRIENDQNGEFNIPFFWWTQRDRNDFLVPWLVLNFTGRHRVLVLSCDKVAYDYLATNIPADAQSNPESNVEGGLGVFCTVGADTAYFYLKNDIKD